jgi:chain length determinant protein EpsF
MFVTICGITLVLALLASLLLPKKYEAEAAVVVDVSGTDPLAENSNTPVQLQPAYLATQMDVIASHAVALKVVDQLKLEQDPRFHEAFVSATGGQGVARDWIADALLNVLRVRSSHNGNVIYVQYSSTNPRKASAIANAFADGYIQTTLELKIDPARRQAGWFDEQVKTLRDALEVAQQKLSAYQKEHGVIGSDDERVDVENARLQEISNQLVEAQSGMYESGARAQQMKEAADMNRPDQLSDVMKSPLLQNLKTELARAEAKFADVSQRYDRNHPEYMSAAAELASLQRKVRDEVENTRGTLAREASIGRQRVADLQRALEEQRARILSLKHTQDDYTVLKRDADNARTAYDTALQRGGQSRLESRLDHTNIAILNHAVVPMEPASPRLLLNLLLAALLGPWLAAAICMMVEMLNRCVHTTEDLFGNDLGPVLGEVPNSGLTLRRSWLRRARRSAPTLHIEPAV